MRRNFALRLALIIVAGVVIFLIVPALGITRPLSDTLGQAARPLLKGLNRLGGGIKRAAVAPFDASKNAQALQSLQSQVRALTAENARLLELERENTELRRELNFIERTKLPVTVARIVGRLSEGGAEFFLLNRGSSEGAVRGAPVIADGVIVGKIVRAQERISVFTPLWTSGEKTAAAFAGSEKTAGIVEGELNVNLRMTLIPKNLALSAGMLIITSGLEERIPRGLLIGRLGRIESGPQELFQTAYLEPAADPKEITIVSILHANEAQ
jgi:rod shape-determining protein MreC